MKRRPESGYALLLVFAMAAAVGIMLYMELPRLVFETQRVKEQDLIDRGEEYRRAIQLYVRRFKKYPASLDDLEKADNIRFLRRRYPDPMTGSEEWRLIHIDNAGRYTDSLIHKPPSEDEEGESQNTFITEGAAIGSTGPAPGAEAARTGAAVRGASDRPVATAEQFRGPQGGGIVAGQPGLRSGGGQRGAFGVGYLRGLTQIDAVHKVQQKELQSCQVEVCILRSQVVPLQANPTYCRGPTGSRATASRSWSATVRRIRRWPWP